jgi:hypothetical protein
VVTGVASSEEAHGYILGHYVRFGWSTNDADNTAGGGTIASSGAVDGLPWVGVLSASDMKLVHAETGDTVLDIRSIAEELASP